MSHRNNFDFLRLFFASLVIISHSYPLTGLVDCDWLCQISDGQLNFSFIGVKGFFVISGYLILASFLRSRNIVDYLWKRLLRLYPALFVVLIITLAVVSIVHETAASSPSFWQQWSTLSYVPRNLSLFKLQYGIDGVFENLPYPSAINGSLWTIPYEFTWYLLLIPLFVVRAMPRLLNISVVVTFLSLLIARTVEVSTLGFPLGLSGEMLVDLGTYFMGGAVLQVLSFQNFGRRNAAIVACAVILTASVLSGHFNAVKYLLFPPLIIGVGISCYPYISQIHTRIGDISYGVYIYAFPLQQLLVYLLHPDHLTLMLLTSILIVPLAYGSWHLVEKRALAFKDVATLWRKV